MDHMFRYRKSFSPAEWDSAIFKTLSTFDVTPRWTNLKHRPGSGYTPDPETWEFITRYAFSVFKKRFREQSKTWSGLVDFNMYAWFVHVSKTRDFYDLLSAPNSPVMFAFFDRGVQEAVKNNVRPPKRRIPDFALKNGSHHWSVGACMERFRPALDHEMEDGQNFEEIYKLPLGAKVHQLAQMLMNAEDGVGVLQDELYWSVRTKFFNERNQLPRKGVGSGSDWFDFATFTPSSGIQFVFRDPPTVLYYNEELDVDEFLRKSGLTEVYERYAPEEVKLFHLLKK